MINPTILGLLRDCDLHGYELKRRIGDLLGTKHNTSWGTLYPALAKLEAQGAVKAVEFSAAAGRPSVPMTGSLGGEAAAFSTIRRVVRGARGKKVYSITAVGWRQFLEFLANPETDEKDFRIKVAFARYLDPALRMGLFQRQAARRNQQILEWKLAQSRISADLYIDSLHQLETRLAHAELVWLDERITHEQTNKQEDPR